MDEGHRDLAAEVSLYLRVEWLGALRRRCEGWGLCRVGGSWVEHRMM